MKNNSVMKLKYKLRTQDEIKEYDNVSKEVKEKRFKEIYDFVGDVIKNRNVKNYRRKVK